MTDTEGTTPKARPGDCGPVSGAPGGHSTPDVGQAHPVAKAWEAAWEGKDPAIVEFVVPWPFQISAVVEDVTQFTIAPSVTSLAHRVFLHHPSKIAIGVDRSEAAAFATVLRTVALLFEKAND